MVSEGSAVDDVVLGLEGFRVRQARQVDGEVGLVAETTALRAWWVTCGARAASKRVPAGLVGDAEVFGKPARLR